MKSLDTTPTIHRRYESSAITWVGKFLLHRLWGYVIVIPVIWFLVPLGWLKWFFVVYCGFKWLLLLWLRLRWKRFGYRITLREDSMEVYLNSGKRLSISWSKIVKVDVMRAENGNSPPRSDASVAGWTSLLFLLMPPKERNSIFDCLERIASEQGIKIYILESKQPIIVDVALSDYTEFLDELRRRLSTNAIMSFTD